MVGLELETRKSLADGQTYKTAEAFKAAVVRRHELLHCNDVLKFLKRADDDFDPHDSLWILKDDTTIDADDDAANEQCKFSKHTLAVLYGIDICKNKSLPLSSSTIPKCFVVASTLQFLSQASEMTVDDRCGLHFHPSLLNEGLSVWRVKQVARAVLWFEPAFDVLVQDERRRSYWCRAHSANSDELRNHGAFGRKALLLPVRHWRNSCR